MSSIYIARHGQTLGSFNEEDVREGISEKRFLRDDLAWRAGMTEWRPLHEVAEVWGFDGSLLSETSTVTAPPAMALEPAWERRAELGFFKALFQTIRSVLFSPSATFSNFRPSGEIKNALCYYLLLSTVSFVVPTLLSLPKILKNPSLLGPEVGKLSQHELLLAFGGVLLLSPLFFTISIFFSSAMTHWSLKIVGGARAPFEATLRVFCYAIGTAAVFQMLSIIGSLVGLVLGVMFYFIGLKKVHAVSGLRLSFAMLVSMALSFLVALLAALLLFKIR